MNVVDSTVSGNTDSAGGQGGGIYSDGTITVTGSTLSANTAEGGGQGAGIYNSGTATVTDSTLSGNTAPGGGQGAGIYNSGTATVTDSTIADNTIPRSGCRSGWRHLQQRCCHHRRLDHLEENPVLDGGPGGGVYSGPANVLQILQQARSSPALKSAICPSSA